MNNISDKCILQNLIQRVNDTSLIIKKRIKIANDILNEIESNNMYQVPIDDAKYNYKFLVDFSDNSNVMIDDKTYIDYNLKVAKPPLLGVSSVPFSCTINKKDFSSFKNITLNDKIINIYIYPSSKTKNILIDMNTESKEKYNYYIYDESSMIASGENHGSLNISIDEKEYKSIYIKIVQKDNEQVKIKSIQIRRMSHASVGEVKTNTFKLYNVSNIKVNTSGKDIDVLLGIKTKNGTNYIDASKNITINNNSHQRLNIVKDRYESLHGLRVVSSIPNNSSRDSISLYKGFLRFKEVLVRGAFVNSDLSLIEYKDSNIIYTKYTDIDDPVRSIFPGDFLMLSHVVISSEYQEINIPYPCSDDVSIKFLVTINGRIIKNNQGRIITFLSSGKNTIIIKIYKETIKDNQDESSAIIGANLRPFSSLIYDEKLKLSQENEITASNSDNLFCFINDKICTKNASKNDSFLIEYDKNNKSESHKEDEKGLYIECDIKVLFKNNSSYVEKIWID